MDPLLKEYKKENQTIGFWRGVLVGVGLGALTLIAIAMLLTKQAAL